MPSLNLTRLLLLTTAVMWSAQPAALRVLACIENAETFTAEIDEEIDSEELKFKGLSASVPCLAASEFSACRLLGQPKLSPSALISTHLHLRGPPAA